MALSIPPSRLAADHSLDARRAYAPAHRIALAVAVHRIDAWGPAAISAGCALVAHNAVTPRGLLLAAAIGALYWLGYAINDCFDAAADAREPRKGRTNPFVHARSSPRVLRAAVMLLMAGLFVVFASFGVTSAVLFGVGTCAMWAYSAPPLRLKSRPGVDLLIHAAFVLTFPYFFVLVVIDQPWTVLDRFLLGLGFITSIGGQLNQQIRDFDVDMWTDRNFTTTFGLRTSITWVRITTVLTLLIVAAGFVTRVLPPEALPIVALCMPTLAYRLKAQANAKPPEGLYGALTVVALIYSTALFWSALR